MGKIKLNEIKKLKAHNFEGAVLTFWEYDKVQEACLWLKGDFGTKETSVTDYKHFKLCFDKIQGRRFQRYWYQRIYFSEDNRKVQRQRFYGSK